MAVDYLHSNLTVEGHRAAVEATAAALRSFGLDRFDAVAWRGISGALVGPVAAYLVNKPSIAIRKSDENSHSTVPAESALGHEVNRWDSSNDAADAVNYIIVDDLVCSGATLRAIIQTVDEVHPGSVPVGVVTYNHTSSEFWEHIRREDGKVWKLPVLGVGVMEKLSQDRLRSFQSVLLPADPGTTEYYRTPLVPILHL